MSKKLLVLTASPRRGGNTEKMADAFIRGARQAGHSVTKYETAFKNIQGCRACDKCWSNGEACARNDDFNELAGLLETHDVLLIASPLYWFSFPAQIKGAIDKLYAYGGAGGLRPLGIKESCLFICGGDSDKEEYKPILQTYAGMVQFLGWGNRGVIQTGGLDAKGAIEASGVLEQAEALGLGI